MSHVQTFQKQNYLYTSLFCEENIWQLCKSLVTEGISLNQLDVLFLSSPKKHIVLFNQQFVDPEKPLTYDYHVILKYRSQNNGIQIFDFDTRLPFPVSWETYQQASFPDPASLPPAYQIIIREIPAIEYLEYFTSDRKHMAHLPESEHPDYACIRARDPNRSIDLKDYWDMNKTIKGTSRIYPYIRQ